jgi:hypothetical protein
MRTMGLIAIWKYDLWSSGSILYFPFFVESFVIGFVIVEIPSVVISKKENKTGVKKSEQFFFF